MQRELLLSFTIGFLQVNPCMIQGTFYIWLTSFGGRHTLKLVSQFHCTTAKLVTADEVANAMNQWCAPNLSAHLGNHMNLRTSTESYRRFEWNSLCWFRYYQKYSRISLAVPLGSLIVLSCYSWFVGSDQVAEPSSWVTVEELWVLFIEPHRPEAFYQGKQITRVASSEYQNVSVYNTVYG